MQVAAEIGRVNCTGTDVTFGILSCLIIFAAFTVPVSICGVVGGVNGTGAISELKNVFVPTANASIIPEATTMDKESRETELDYYYNYDSNENSREDAQVRDRRKPDGHKVAQVIVYFSVIFIALAGVLIRYFVTQYETSQMKAHEQLNYQRLQDQQL